VTAFVGEISMAWRLDFEMEIPIPCINSLYRNSYNLIPVLKFRRSFVAEF
jgi:hypothetical protein